jgi:hypothetical protein
MPRLRKPQPIAHVAEIRVRMPAGAIELAVVLDGVGDSGLARVQAAAARRFHRVPRATPAAAAELEATPITQVPPKLLHGPGAGWFVKRPPYDAYSMGGSDPSRGGCR